MTTPSKEAVEAAIVAFQHENAMSRANAELYCPRWVALALDAFAARGGDDREPCAWATHDANGSLWKVGSWKADVEREAASLNSRTDTSHYKACGPYRVVPLYVSPPPPDAAARFQEAAEAYCSDVPPMLIVTAHAEMMAAYSALVSSRGAAPK